MPKPTIFFVLVKQVFPETTHPYRIHEIVTTSDGLRTRVCDGVWSTEQNAIDNLEAKERKYNERSSPSSTRSSRVKGD